MGQLTGNGWMKTVSPPVPCDDGTCSGLQPLNEYVYRCTGTTSTQCSIASYKKCARPTAYLRQLLIYI